VVSVFAAPIVNMVAKAMDVQQRLGKRVREKRNELGLSQEAFADKCKLDRTYISGIERGKRNVSLVNIEVIAKSLGISIAELMEGV
jgi:transcriptional regulator with XRE-family HTH domain